MYEHLQKHQDDELPPILACHDEWAVLRHTDTSPCHPNTVKQ